MPTKRLFQLYNICSYVVWVQLYSTRELQWLEYLKLVFLKILNVTTWSVFQNQVTYFIKQLREQVFQLYQQQKLIWTLLIQHMQLASYLVQLASYDFKTSQQYYSYSYLQNIVNYQSCMYSQLDIYQQIFKVVGTSAHIEKDSCVLSPGHQ